MDIFAWLTALGGLSLFLYGMYLMAESLPRMAGGRTERLLEKMSDSPGKAVLMGAGATALVQSSSAVTVMAVGLVDAGMLELSRSVGIIMGANVGTTVTAWILGMAGVDSDSTLVRLFRPTSFAPVLGMAGVLILLFSTGKKGRDRASVLMGFSILMFGMDTMCRAAKPLADMPEFLKLLDRFSNPIAGVAAGSLLTALIQSSSASVGMLQAVCAAGAIEYGTVIPLILGINIGTCATVMLSGVGAGRNARCAARVHLYFNGIGAALFLAGLYTVNFLLPLPLLKEPATGFGIALIHSAFNIGTTLVLLPFSRELAELACFTGKARMPAVRFRLPGRREMTRRRSRRDMSHRGMTVR